MRLPMMRWITFSAFFALSGCATIQKPDIELEIVNAGMKQAKGYNLQKDYDDAGNIKAGAVPTVRPAASVADLDKRLCIDSSAGPEEAIARLKTYIKLLRENYANNCKQPAAR